MAVALDHALVSDLVSELAEAKLRYADLYLRARSDTAKLTTDESRMNARLGVARTCRSCSEFHKERTHYDHEFAMLRDPEIIRFELLAVLGVRVAVAED